MPSEEYNVGCYLLDRLAQLGCGHLFGVPGDYNLRFLDDVEASADIEWVGCANELNAAYAADGYSRIRRFGAVLTTYGVGELSALNGIAGSAAERNPVVHIVGGPRIEDANARKIMHHTLGDGDFHNFSKMSEQISCAVARLTPENAREEIDRVLTETYYHKKPGFILLPMDVATVLTKPPASPLEPREPALSAASLAAFTKAVEAQFQGATRPAALVGYLCDRYLCKDAAEKLVTEAHLPFAHMLLGKDTLNEQLPNYVGCYFGSTTPATTRTVIERADVLVMLGVRFHDFGTGYFSQVIDPSRTIDIQPFNATVDGQLYDQIPMAKAIEVVTAIASRASAAFTKEFPKPVPLGAPTESHFTAFHFWNEVQAGLAPGDILVVDQGTSSSAAAGLIMPANTNVLVQCLWGSIGFSIPAAFGAQMAAPDRRVVLAVGDGSAQMTAQEFSAFTRRDLRSVIFLVNNDGYVIERVIHGWNAAYNDIASWNWCPLIEAMSVQHKPVTKTVKEEKTVLAMMKDTQKKRDQLTFYEVILGRHEVPIVSLAWKPQ